LGRLRHRHGGLILRRLCAAALAFAVILSAPALKAQPSLEYAVKAAYLAKFAPFIEWPDGTFPDAAAPLTLCILGSDPFGAELDRAVAGQKDGDHPMVLRRITAIEATTGCQLLFTNDAPLAQQALEQVRTRPVVTVTDSSLRTRGVISFVMVDNHVRFDIDKSAADAVGLNISSKLLALAHNVRQRGAR